MSSRRVDNVLVGNRLVDFDREIIVAMSSDKSRRDEVHFPSPASVGKGGVMTCIAHNRNLDSDFIGRYCPLCLIEVVIERRFHGMK